MDVYETNEGPKHMGCHVPQQGGTPGIPGDVSPWHSTGPSGLEAWLRFDVY